LFKKLAWFCFQEIVTTTTIVTTVKYSVFVKNGEIDMSHDTETLRGILIFGIVVVCGLFLYWIWLFFKLVSIFKLKMSATPFSMNNAQIMELIKAAHEDSGWEYRWIGPIEPPGQIILAWREWNEEVGYKDRTLEVFFVKNDGTVETLATAVECDIYGPAEDM